MNIIKKFTQARVERSRQLRFSHWGAIGALLATLGLVACGGGADTTSNPEGGGGNGAFQYTGPEAATDDVRAFKRSLWDPLVMNGRCVECHGGSQTPTFVNTSNVNIAYTEALANVNLGNPGDSRLVQKVGGGHNCWLESDSACASIMTDYIAAWAGGGPQEGGRTIQLTPPRDAAPGATLIFPTDTTFFQPVHNLLTTYCAGCHVDGMPTSQSPFFAESDINVAYEAAKSKMDLENPANSRFVLRLGQEFHNCWSNCTNDAEEMRLAIAGLAANATSSEPDPNLAVSRALLLTDGVVASGGNRFESNVVALWEFKTGEGTTAYDLSGIEPAINLTFNGDVQWVGGWGIQLGGGKAQGSTTSSKKLHDTIKATGEYSIEAWVIPGNVTQEEARIVNYALSTTSRNFMLGQTLYNYDFFNRAGNTDNNGDPAVSTPDADEDLQATLQHVVATYDSTNGRRIYVNGELTNATEAGGSNILNWDDTYAFVLGNEVSSDRPWQGIIRLAAIHNRAMTQEQVQQNYEAGVGEKFFLLFGVSHLIDVPQSYIMMEVSQYDSYSYLFHSPTFITLDAAAQPDNILVQGMRIGINGKEADKSQVYANMNETVTAASYTANGQLLSRLGTVIALENGPTADEFFLTFDRIGDSTSVRSAPAAPVPPTPTDAAPVSDIGLHTFDEVNAAMAAMTGVEPFDSTSPNFSANVNGTFNTVRQALPTVESIDGFVSSHQTAITQLAIAYCDAVVNNTSLRNSARWWPGYSFPDPANTTLDEVTEQDAIINPLLINVANTGLTTQPTDTEMRTELRALMSNLSNCGGTCPAGRTEDVVKATCAAAVGSAVMLVQ